MIRRHIVLTATLGLAAVAGCNDQPKAPYGNGMLQQDPAAGQTSSASAADQYPLPPVDQIPAGAQRLSQGTYNQIMFTVPDNGAGSLFLWDVTTQKMVGMTNSVQSNAGKSMTMADLKNTAQGLNMTDTYQVYFAPVHPTTRPIGGGGSGM